MKPAVSLLLFVLALPLARADSWLSNGDFTSGNDHWYGEAKWPSDFAPSDPFTKADPFTSQGMIIPLKSGLWVKEFQDFKGRGSNATLTITYVASPDLAFSQKADDYVNVPDKIGWDAWVTFNGPVNSWIVFVSELSEQKGTYYVIQPKLGTSEEQTFRSTLTGVPWSAKTIAFAFPPGQGTIVIKKVELTDDGGGQ